MSFSVNTGVSSAALDALSHAGLEHSAGRSAACIADDGDVPPCGTHPPGNPPFPWARSSLLDQVALNPQPLPPLEANADHEQPPSGFVARTFAEDDVPPCGTHPPRPPIPWPLAFASMLDPLAVNPQTLLPG